MTNLDAVVSTTLYNIRPNFSLSLSLDINQPSILINRIQNLVFLFTNLQNCSEAAFIQYKIEIMIDDVCENFSFLTAHANIDFDRIN